MPGTAVSQAERFVTLFPYELEEMTLPEEKVGPVLVGLGGILHGLVGGLVSWSF